MKSGGERTNEKVSPINKIKKKIEFMNLIDFSIKK